MKPIFRDVADSSLQGLAPETLVYLLENSIGPHQERVTSFRGLNLYRLDSPTAPTSCTYPLSFLWIAQGQKRIDAKGRCFLINPGSYLITETALPVMSQVTRASRATPYLAFFLKFEIDIVRQVIAESTEPARPASTAHRPAGVSVLTPELSDCCARILRLTTRTDGVSFLESLLIREIIFLLLQGEQGTRLRQSASSSRELCEAEKAVEWLSRHYAAPLRIGRLAKICGMGTSTLYLHFKKLTGMSPLQYQKQLRLQAARQKLRAGHAEVTATAYCVGYQSPSQFSREYKRYFGLSHTVDARAEQGDE